MLRRWSKAGPGIHWADLTSTHWVPNQWWTLSYKTKWMVPEEWQPRVTFGLHMYVNSCALTPSIPTHRHTHIHIHPINKYSRCIVIHKWQLSYQMHWSLDLIQMMVPWAAQTLVKPWVQSTHGVLLVLFLYVHFFQLMKHSLKSRSCKDLARMFRKEKRSLTSYWVSGTHSGLPWSLHTDFFRTSRSFMTNQGESEELSWLSS